MRKQYFNHMELQFQYALTNEAESDLHGGMLGKKQELCSTLLKIFEYLCSRQKFKQTNLKRNVFFKRGSGS